ncbi:hypothetical protein DNTS_015585 [Danionella cerebrum]|uniref:LIM zinc-binding domain-containing protein n=1 Tax=Danionella cerebrum TaxID=2873325 RepID=A0A553R1Q2_9TELE|nr:hypothetical protein DNTS_015585 [Danionella translucida]
MLKFRPAARETCVMCLKTVYPLEKLVANQQIYHNTCFRCAYCNTKLRERERERERENLSNLFKAKGNYDEGFGHRPHKELWEARGEGDEEQMKLSPQGSDSSPTVEESPLVKVNVLTATLETLTQASPERMEKPLEAGRLKISWPPLSEGDRSSTNVGSANDSNGIKPIRPKWPPEGDSVSSISSEQSDLPKLRRSISLKERSKPFCTFNPPAVIEPSKRCQRSPLNEKSSSEEEMSPISSTSDTVISSEDMTEHNLSEDDEEEEQGLGNTKVEDDERMDQEDKADPQEVELSSLKCSTPDNSSALSPERAPGLNQTSQDVGFWDAEEAELTVEDLIKRNRYYDDDDEV